MRPVNQKSIYATVCKNIEEVEKDTPICLEDKIMKADAIVRMARMATDMIALELKIAKEERENQEFNKTAKTPVFIRQIESKGFDDTTK